MLKKYFNKPSLFLFALPYIAISWYNIFKTGNFTWLNFSLIISFLLLISIVFNYLMNFKNKILLFFIFSGFNFFLLFLYSKIIHISIFNYLYLFINPNYLRFRWFLFLVSIIQLLLLLKIKSFRFLNLFCFVIFCLILFNKLNNNSESNNQITKISNSQIQIHNGNSTEKPVILIITDEYSSPDELYKITNDSSFYEYSKSLQQKGWVIKNSFHSNETSTIHSISSLFNFNLSRSKVYSKQSVINIASNKLLTNNLCNSLKRKKVNIINFGIFDFGNSTALSDLYNYPKSYYDQFLLFSIYFELRVLKINFNSKVFTSMDYLYEVHNKFILNKICDTINDDRSFLYAHLYMPHAPFVYSQEFINCNTTTPNYIKYWRFTNQKVLKILKKLMIGNKYRIIITGDHGYRSETKISGNNTFAAFYGFNKTDIDKIKSVQDLGSLINGYF